MRITCDGPALEADPHDSLVAWLVNGAAESGRPDLVRAARWLADHPPGSAPDVICHGDLHPFNLLAGASRP